MAALIIDEIDVIVLRGRQSLDAAEQAEISIPHFCSHPDLPPVEPLKQAEDIKHGNKPMENKMPDSSTQAVSFSC